MFSAIAALSTCAIAIASGDSNTCDEGTMLQVNLAKVRKHSSNATQRAHSDDTPQVAVLGCPGSYARNNQPPREVRTGTANVYCCSIDGNQCEAVRRHVNDCQAHTDKTFAEAQDICSSEGLRLCTEDEIGARMCCGRGCDFAFYQVWTSPVQISQAAAAADVYTEDPCNEESWPSIKNGQVCGACKVLVDDFDSEYGTCDSYCERMGRQCMGAWEERRNNCEVEEDMTCSEARGTSDAICECAPKESAAAPGYEHIPGACVSGKNLAYYNDEYTPAQCAEICDAEPRCVAFEYVPPGATRHRPACRPQSSSNQGNCDGTRYDMDLYVKN